MIAIPVELSEEQADRLRALADRFKLPVEDYLRLHVLEHVEAESEELAGIADRVFTKNDELLRRLA